MANNIIVILFNELLDERIATALWIVVLDNESTLLLFERETITDTQEKVKRRCQYEFSRK